MYVCMYVRLYAWTYACKLVTLRTTELNIKKKSLAVPTERVNVFFMDLRINRDYLSVQRYIIGFYNRERTCLLRGTISISKYSSGYICV